MATTLPFGRIRPDSGDKGSSFFPALETNINLDDAHSHNGVDSPVLSTTSIVNTTQAIVAGLWAAVAGKSGLFSQIVTLPGALLMAKTGIFFKDTATGDLYNLSVEQASANSYEVFINDNTKNITAVYV